MALNSECCYAECRLCVDCRKQVHNAECRGSAKSNILNFNQDTIVDKNSFEQTLFNGFEDLVSTS